MVMDINFYKLQQDQRKHDERNHVDIYCMRPDQKLNHFVLHFTKYAARLAAPMSAEETLTQLRRTFVDASLIGLSAANTLEMDLDEIRKSHPTWSGGEYLERKIARPIGNTTFEQLREYSCKVLIISVGAMADTLEKRDHLEEVNSRIILRRGTWDILQTVLYGSEQMNLDLTNLILKRREEIAEKKVL